MTERKDRAKVVIEGFGKTNEMMSIIQSDARSLEINQEGNEEVRTISPSLHANFSVHPCPGLGSLN